MCDPVTASITAQVIGVGISAYGVWRQGQSASAEADFRSQIASNNDIIAGQNAEIALEKGRAEIRDERLKTRQRIGLQRAQLAAQGFDVAEGSSIDILGDTAALGELDVLRIESDAENKARSFRIQAGGFESEATLGRLASKEVKRAGKIGAVSTLITGAGRAGTTSGTRQSWPLGS